MIVAEQEKLFYQAINKLKQGDIPASVDLLLDLTTRFPDFAKANNYLGEIYFNYFKDADAAEVYFKKAIAAAPAFTSSYINYARVLLEQERFTELNANLNKVSEIPGAEKDKVNELFGLMNELQGKYEPAIQYYKKAITLTFSNEDLSKYEQAIARCEIKKKYV